MVNLPVILLKYRNTTFSCPPQPRNMMLSLPVKLWSSRFPVCLALAWTRLASSLPPWLTASLWLLRLKKSRPPLSSRWRRSCACLLLLVTSTCLLMIWLRTSICQSTSWSPYWRSTGKMSGLSTSKHRWVALNACTKAVPCESCLIQYTCHASNDFVCNFHQHPKTVVKPSTSQLLASIAVQVRHQFPRNEGELFRTYSEQHYVHEAVVLVKKIPSTERSIPNRC